MGPVVQQLIAAGYSGYAGWDDASAAADFNATQGAGKGQGGGSGPGSIPAFNFDYEGEAKKAFAELGPYYDQVLKESKGDLDKALARLVADYDRGLRIRKEDTATASQGIDIASKNAKEGIVNDSLSRGLYQKSNFAPAGEQDPYGLTSANLNQYQTDVEGRQREQLATGLSRYQEESLLNKSRSQEDLTEAQVREARELERRRKLEAGELANLRGNRALTKYQTSLTLI